MHRKITTRSAACMASRVPLNHEQNFYIGRLTESERKKWLQDNPRRRKTREHALRNLHAANNVQTKPAQAPSTAYVINDPRRPRFRQSLILKGDADIRTTHAIVLQTKGANLQSLRELQEIIHDHPDHLYAREQAALVCKRLNCYEVALANFNFILERRVTTKLLGERADVFLALGRPLSAAADFSAVLEREPDNVFFIKRRAKAYVDAEMYDLGFGITIRFWRPSKVHRST
jgi:tetratricopeptide (TPR) repeat protein